MVATTVTLLFLASASPALAEPMKPALVHTTQTPRSAIVQNAFLKHRRDTVKRRLRIVC